jgi:hypothetical protein
MTAEQERAAQFWAILVIAARGQMVLSYRMLERMTGLPAFAQAPVLKRIENYCEKSNFPRLTAIVVSQRTGVPGHLFPGFSAEQKDPEATADPDGQHAIRAQREQSRAFVCDWESTVPGDHF